MTNNMTGNAAQFSESIMSLPPLPVTAQKILTCFGDEFIEAAKVADVVEGDPGICARLLGLSNSAYFGLSEPVTSIEEAISRVLGVDTVRSLVLAMAIQRSFDSKHCPCFDVERFWTQSLLAAECCRKIALADSDSDAAERDLAYTAGLCHNLGLMALVHMEPVRTNAVLERHALQDDPDSLERLFAEEFDTNHKIITAELARIWSLPEPMVYAYQFRACPGQNNEHRLALVVAAGVAATENAAVEDEFQSSLEAWSDGLDIDVEELQKMAAGTERQKERVQSMAGNMTR